MNRILSRAHCLLQRGAFALILPALSLCLWAGGVSAAQAAPVAAAKSPTLLVLPFAVNASPDLARRMEADLPALLRQRFSAAGFRVLSAAETRRVAGQTVTRDPAKARSLAKSARADYAVFGSFSQVGDSFSLDVRLVDATAPAVRPYYAEKATVLELPAALDELAEQAFAGATNKDSLADIQIRGLRLIDPDRVLVRLNTRKGDAVNVDDIDEDVRRVWDMGYFSDVSADIEESGQGKVLVFTVAEKPRIDDVRVEGSDAVKIGDITEAMSSRTGTVLNAGRRSPENCRTVPEKRVLPGRGFLPGAAPSRRRVGRPDPQCRRGQQAVYQGRGHRRPSGRAAQGSGRLPGPKETVSAVMVHRVGSA